MWNRQRSCSSFNRIAYLHKGEGQETLKWTDGRIELPGLNLLNWAMFLMPSAHWRQTYTKPRTTLQWLRKTRTAAIVSSSR